MKPEKILKKHTPEILQKRGVVTVGLGNKWTGGKDTGKVALVVGVKQKLPISLLAVEDVIPTEVKGLVTDVWQVGEIKLLNEIDRKSRIRPAPGGVSIGNVIVTAGTFGCLVYKGGQPFILSNNHVLAAVNKAEIGSSIVQPGTYDGGTLNDEIAKLSEFIEIKILGVSGCGIAKSITAICNFLAQLFKRRTRVIALAGLEGNTVDCAIAKPNTEQDVTDNILEIGIPIGEAEPVVGMKVKKSGRSSGLTHGEVIQVGVTANVQVGEGKIAMFTDQFAMGGDMSEPGDSGSDIITDGDFFKEGDAGSILVAEDGTIVGLLFAGSDMLTLANRWTNVKAKLGLD